MPTLTSMDFEYTQCTYIHAAKILIYTQKRKNYKFYFKKIKKKQGQGSPNPQTSTEINEETNLVLLVHFIITVAQGLKQEGQKFKAWLGNVINKTSFKYQVKLVRYSSITSTCLARAGLSFNPEQQENEKERGWGGEPIVTKHIQFQLICNTLQMSMVLICS